MCFARGAMLAAALGAVLFAQEPPRAACTKPAHGTLWPAEANADRRLARELIQSGELYICQAGRFTAQWKLVAVNIRNLGTLSSRKRDRAEARTEPDTLWAFLQRLARH